MNEIDMKMYATGMIREYCQTLSDGICQIASACEMGPSDSAGCDRPDCNERFNRTYAGISDDLS